MDDINKSDVEEDEYTQVVKTNEIYNDVIVSALDTKMENNKFSIANEAKRNEIIIIIGKRILKLWRSKSFFSLH